MTQTVSRWFVIIIVFFILGIATSAQDNEPLVSSSDETTQRYFVFVHAETDIGVSQTALQQRLTNFRNSLDPSISIVRQYTYLPALIVNISAEEAQILALRADVVAVVPDAAMQVHSNGVVALNLPALHVDGTNGEGVTVALLDTGINPNSSYYDEIDGSILVENCITQAACKPFGIDTGSSAEDGGEHGTYVANVIHAYAPAAQLVPIRVLDDNGAGYLSDWLAGLEWIRQNYLRYDIEIVNMSLGTIETFAGTCDAENALFAEVKTLVDMLDAVGVTIVTSTGNSGVNENALPACLSNVIAVGATYAEDLGRVPSSGTYRDEAGDLWADCADETTSLETVACFSNYGSETDILAPGVHASGLYGTSFAAPAISGIVALMKQVNPTLSPQAIHTALVNNGQTISGSSAPLVNPTNTVLPDPQITANCNENNTIPDGDVTELIAQINSANNSVGITTICLTPNSTYTLSAALDGSGHALPLISGSIRIQGRGAILQQDDYANKRRYFDVSATGNLTVRNLTFKRGADRMLENAGNLTLDYVQITDTYNPSNSGALIGNYNILTISNVEFYDNLELSQINYIYNNTNAKTHIYDSHIYNNYFTSYFIQNLGVLDIQNLSVADNEITSIFITGSGDSPSTTIDNLLYTNNHAFDETGSTPSAQGHFFDGNGLLSIDNSVFSHISTHALIEYGANALPNNFVLKNTTFSTIFTEASFISLANNITATVDNVVIDDLWGGAIFVVRSSSYESTFTHVYISDIRDGLIFNVQASGNVRIENSTLSNQERETVAIYIGGIATFINSTLTNVGTLTVRDDGILNIINTTIANSQTNGIRTIQNDIATVNVKNSFITSNSDNCSSLNSSVLTINTFGTNYGTDTSCTGFIQVDVQDLQLLALADYVGKTPTVSLYPDSVAIDAATDCTDLLGNPITTDQRGLSRPIGAACDVGAFEWRVADTPLPQDDFADASAILGLASYGSTVNTQNGTYETGEPDACFTQEQIIEQIIDGKSYHIAIGGRSNYRSLRSGRSNYRSLRSGGIFYRILTANSNYTTLIGIYRGDELVTTMELVGCSTAGSGEFILQITSDDIEADATFRIMIWDIDPAASGGELDLSIDQITFHACSEARQIPERDCNALVDLFNLTGGENWIEAYGWLDTTLPCDTWYGVECTNGRVSGLALDGNNLTNLGDLNSGQKYSELLAFYEQSGDSIYVNTTQMAIADDGSCSLPEAIIAANTDSVSGSFAGECSAGSGADTIDLGGYTYIFDSAYDQHSALPQIQSEIILQGSGATLLRNPAPDTPRFRFLYVTANAILTIDNLTLANGFSPGQNTCITSELSCKGGAILQYGNPSQLTIQNSTFYGNQAEHSGGAIYSGGNSETTSVSITNTIFEDNFAKQGGAIYTLYVPMNASNSTFRLNSSNNAVILTHNANINLVNSHFELNEGYSTYHLGFGQVNVSNNTFLANQGLMVFHPSTSGIHAAIVNNLFYGNRVANTNSGGTVSGLIHLYATPASSLRMQLINNTFVNNGSSFTGDIFQEANSLNSNHPEIFMQGNVFDNNPAPICSASVTSNNFTSLGYNISDETVDSCNFTATGDLTNTDGRIHPFTSQYGDVQYLIPLSNSPAIDHIPVADCVWDHDFDTLTPAQALTTDYRGVSRPQNGDCDSGAYEFDGLPWDVNNDGIISPTDAIYAINRLGSTLDLSADVDGDGDVDAYDVQYIQSMLSEAP